MMKYRTVVYEKIHIFGDMNDENSVTLIHKHYMHDAPDVNIDVPQSKIDRSRYTTYHTSIFTVLGSIEDGLIQYRDYILRLVRGTWHLFENNGRQIGILNSNNDLDSLCTAVDSLLLLWNSLMKSKSVFQ